MASSGPAFVRFFGPVLQALEELGGSGRPTEVTDVVAVLADVSPEEQAAVNKNGGSRFQNQVAWARFYLSKAGYLDSSSRGVWALSESGLANSRMTHTDALRLFSEVHAQWKQKEPTQDPQAEDPVAPAEGDEVTVPSGTTDFRVRLMERLHALTPSGFEKFCQRLLRESGFQTVEVTGRSGDGGIDGIGILEVNALVSFKVLFQCKRYQGSVSSSQLRDFRGAMAGRTDKGIVITTGAFTAEARKEAVRDGAASIELVDGEKLVAMCERVGLGLREVRSHVVDEGFFDHIE